MDLERVRGEPAELREARERIAQWRRERTKLGPMPAALWVAAGAAARRFGVNHVARVLGLNHNVLKARLSRPAPAPNSARFVELSNLPSPRPAQEGMVEVVAPDGARLIIHGVGSSSNASALIAAFRERR